MKSMLHKSALVSHRIQRPRYSSSTFFAGRKSTYSKRHCKAGGPILVKAEGVSDRKVASPRENVFYELIDEDSIDLKRHAEPCLDPKVVDTLRSHPDAQAVPVIGKKCRSVVKGPHGEVRAVRVPLREVQSDNSEDLDSILLGVDENNAPIFAVGVESEEWAANTPSGPLDVVDLRTAAPLLPHHDAAVLGLARSMVNWSSTSRFCGRCGSATTPKRAGRLRVCSSKECGERFRPRLDPAIIVLVTYGDYCLLGHQSRWVPGRYSLLAGFVEVCETMEHAVVREVEEETGVFVDKESVSFVSSQPWPFPQSLMLGFRGQVTNQSVPTPYLPPITPDGKEITDARWFHRSWIRQYLFQNAKPTVPSSVTGVEISPGEEAACFSIPDGGSIANRILHAWAAEDSYEGAGDVVKIDLDGGMKYMLLKLKGNDGVERLIVRGDKRAGYHRDVIDHTEREFPDFKVSQQGGGFITARVSPSEIYIYGESSRFGPPEDLSVVCEMIQQSNPFHRVIPSAPLEGPVM